MSLSLVLLILFLVCTKTMSSENQDFTLAKCEPDREQCRDCYFALVRSLLGSADNMLSLISVFSPPGKK